MRYIKGLAIASALLGFVAFGAPAASAAGTGTGVLAFEGTATLPIFPCPASPCAQLGQFTGKTTGTASGVTAANEPYTVTWSGETGAKSDFEDAAGPPLTFNYTELAATCPLEGTANATGKHIRVGTANTDATDTVQGAVLTPVPVAITGIDATFDFGWIRVGATAAITTTITNLHLILANGSTRDITGPLGTGVHDAGVAAFVVQGGLPPCNGGPITATVAGADVIAPA